MQGGLAEPNISAISAATSITISWTHPSAKSYTVSLALVTGCSHDLPQPEMTTLTSTIITGLEEFSTYMVTVTAHLGGAQTATGVASVMTQSAGTIFLNFNLH
jgi:hypothetical protein